MSGENESLNRYLEMLRTWQCEPCKKGDHSKCPKSVEEGAMAYIENPNSGERTHFCNAGCMLLRIFEIGGDGALKQAVERQFNREGHGTW